MNQNIASMQELDINERIAEIEKFLEEQEKKAIKPITIPKKLEEPLPPDNVLTLLKKITENQEIDRKRYERENAIEGDEVIHDWAEATINPGQMVQFIYKVPEGRVFHLSYPSITHNIETTYYIWIDGQYQPTLSQTLIDFGDHQKVYVPPVKAYNNVQVWALNNWVAPQDYACFIKGWNRYYRAIGREITYESLEKEKQET